MPASNEVDLLDAAIYSGLWTIRGGCCGCVATTALLRSIGLPDRVPGFCYKALMDLTFISVAKLANAKTYMLTSIAHINANMLSQLA